MFQCTTNILIDSSINSKYILNTFVKFKSE